jgi:hypothetical protein
MVSTGAFLQRAAVWCELIESTLRKWLTQAHTYPRSFSVLAMMMDERLWKGPVEKPSGNGTQTHDALDNRSCSLESNEANGLQPVGHEPLLKEGKKPLLKEAKEPLSGDVVAPISIDFTGTDQEQDSHSFDIGRAPSRQMDESEIPDSILPWTESGDKKYATEVFRDTLSYVTTNRTLCITETGYIGLMPRHTLPTDKVVVLFGGTTPFVILECQDSQSGSRKSEDIRYQLVGEAYIHSIMDGEVPNGLTEHDLEARSETFTLV